MSAAAPDAAPFPQHGIWLAGAALGAVAMVLVFRDGPLLEAWHLAFVGLSGLATGSLGLLMIGHLLGGYWLDPVRSELEAAALTMPLVAILGVPLAAGFDLLYPWSADPAAWGLPEPRAAYLETSFLLLRGAVYLALWTALALWIARPGDHRGASAVGLALLTPTATLAAIDWVMSREPPWWSSLFGFAFAASQLLPALAGTVLVDIVRPERPDDRRLRSLERALITLSLMTLWLWFVQFLVVWMANLPEEAFWYLARAERHGWLMFGVILPAMLVGIVLLLPPRVGGVLMVSACVLLLVQHAGHMVWLVRPAARDDAGSLWLDAVVLAGLGGLWAWWFVEGLWQRPNVAAAERKDEGPARPRSIRGGRRSGRRRVRAWLRRQPRVGS